MRTLIRSLALYIAIFLGMAATAQNAVTVTGVVSPCIGLSYPVRFTTNTVPAIDTTIYTGANCAYSFTFFPVETSGTFGVETSCDGGVTWNAVTGSWNMPFETIALDLSCNGASGPMNDECFNGTLITADSSCVSISGNLANATETLPPINCAGFMSSLANDVWYRFYATGITSVVQVNGDADLDVVLEVFMGSCTALGSLSCSDNTLDGGLEEVTFATIPGQEYFYRIYEFTPGAPASMLTFTTCVIGSNSNLDCEDVLGGTALPGTSCDDGDPATINDTWSANCICAGTICEAPVITSPSGFLAICSSDSLILQATTTGTGPLTYIWTGPGTFIPNNNLQNVYLHDFSSGTYQVTVTNACGTADAEVQVAVTPAPDAGISAGVSICDITVPTDLFLGLEGNPQTGGSWSYAGQPHSSVFNPAIDSLGAYQYTILGTAPCSYSAATVFISPIPTWFGDADGDGLGDLDVSLVSCIQPVGYVNNDADFCPSIYGTIGSICDDGNPLTTNDFIDATCVCAGIDSSNVDCLNIPNGPNVTGTACILPNNEIGTWDVTCTCIPDTTTTVCNAGFWVLQAYDSTAAGGVEPIPNEVWIWNLSTGTSPYQFFWNFGDGTSSTDPFPTHFYASGGPYTLCLTMSDAFNCTATYCDSVSVDANGIYNGFAGEPNNNRSGFTINVLQQQPTAINEHENWNALELWPNPVSEEINLSLIGSRSNRLQLSVIDLNGRVVKSSSNAIAKGNNRYSLPVNDLESGMYLLRISNDNNEISRRFVKN